MSSTYAEKSGDRKVSRSPEAAQGKGKSSLRGLDFAAQEQALAPQSEAPGGEGGQASVDPGTIRRAIAFNQKATWARHAANVRAIQGVLDRPITGAWDGPTVEAVMGFQQNAGLSADGQVGKQTRARLKSETRHGAGERDEDEDGDGASREAAHGRHGGGEAEVNVGGPLKAKDIAKAQATHRSKPFEPAWVTRLQAAVGAPVTGVLDTATVQKLAEFQASAGMRVHGTLDQATQKALRTTFPMLDVKTSEQRVEASDAQGKKSHSEASDDPAEDEAAKKVGHGSMAAYVSRFVNGNFLGKTVTGHPSFISRLQAAERALQVQFPETSSADLGKTLGSTVSNSYRPSRPGRPQSFHGIGQALDINKDKNPWVAGNPDAKTANKFTVYIIEYACDFMGIGTPFGPAELHKWGRDLPTEELWAKIEQTNQALITYRQMASDKAAIEAQFNARQSGPNPMTGERAKLAFWLKKVPAHHEMLKEKRSNWKGETKNLGFMDHSKVLVSALRDAGGLAWGGVDLSERQSSDMMHFDNRNDSEAMRFMSHIRSIRDKRAPKG